MAEELLFKIGEEMLGKVISLVTDEITLAWGFKDELQRLVNSLEMVNSLIYDASSNNKTHELSVQVWLKELNDVAYRADAVLDEFAYETLRTKLENQKRDKVLAFFSPSKNPLLFHQKLAHKIKQVNLSLHEIYAKGTQIKLVERKEDATIAKHNERLTHPFLGDDDSNIVGREVDILNVVNMLCGSDHDGNYDLPVMAIIGLGGQGKTTLAQLVCKHDKVLKHFDKIIWVCVSKDFEVTRLLNEMIESLTGEDSHFSNVQAIINEKLGPRLKLRRYLLVLDDVWNHEEDKWSCFRSALLEIKADGGSQIMVTTRSNEVAFSMKTSLNYPLQRLSDEDSWTFFKQRAFGEGGAAETSNLEDIGKEIVKKCQGLPLAIKVIGSMMYSKESKNDWLLVQNSQLWNSEDTTSRVLQSLKLSYDDLSFPLKRCFSFCSFYPKDAIMQKNELIQSWMALGLLQPLLGSGLVMEDVGEKYFKTLLSCSLVDDVMKDEHEAITSWNMHDIIHDLALKTAQTDYPLMNSLALVSDHVDSMLHLRVLVLADGLLELPDSIEKLKHLRYLDISDTSISKLPNSITKLYKLQTIKVSRLLRVSKDFGNLINLRHLCVKNVHQSWGCMLTGIGRLTCLQTLTFFHVHRERGCQIKELGSLNDLRGNLTIFGLERVQNIEEAKHALLSEKCRLRALTLQWGYRGEDDSRIENDGNVLNGLEPHSELKDLTIELFAGRNFPRWMMVKSQASQVLGKLVKLRLIDCDECEKIPPIGHLQHLKYFEINGMRNVEEIGQEFYGKHTMEAGGVSSSRGGSLVVKIFPALREFILKGMPKLKRWPDAVPQQSSVSLNVFPCLERLHIDGSAILCTLPSHFPSVTELKIKRISCLSLKAMSRTLTTLTSLDIEECFGLEFQTIMAEMLGNNNRSLRQLRIADCHCFLYVPNNLVALERLQLSYCRNLELINDLPSAREVEIYNCSGLIGLPSLIQVFPVLEKLRIISCDSMVAVPDMHSHTCLRELSIQYLNQLTSVTNICKSLQSLEIAGCEQLTILPEKLGKTLHELMIQYCDNLVSFPDFQYLRILSLGNVCSDKGLEYFPWPSSFASIDEEEGNDDIQCLQHLYLRGWPEIKSLPEKLQDLTGLITLKLEDFDGVESLPEWLGNLCSLQSLSIVRWKNLKYLPSVEAMRRLDKLKNLRIYECPILETRCSKGSRPEWRKISHIPTIRINQY